MNPKSPLSRWLVRSLLLVSVFLPLLFAPGLKSTFSSPKLILLGFVLVLGLPVAIALKVTPFWLPFPLEVTLLLWLVSLSLSSIQGAVVSTTALLIQMFGVGWFTLLVLVRPPTEKLAGAIVLSGAGISSVSLLQWLGIDPFVLAGWIPLGITSTRMRVYATLGSPNFVSAFLTTLVPITMGLSKWLRPSNRRLAQVVLVIVGLELLAIAATGSRAAIPGLIGGAVGWALLYAKQVSWRIWTGFLGVCLVLLAASPARSLKTTIQGRVYLWKITLQHIGEAPIFGLGPGAFEAFFPRWETDWHLQDPGENSVIAGLEDHAHNDFLEIWVEQGAFGLLSFTGVLIACYFAVRRSLSFNHQLLTSAVAGIGSMLAIALVDFPFHRVETCFLFWTLIAFLALMSDRNPA